MQRLAGIILLIFSGLFFASAQEIRSNPADTSKKAADTLRPAPYVNQGKIAARRAAIQSATLPGLGQLKTNVNVWSVGKVVIIYGGFAALTISYIDNTKYYKIFLKELQYRQANGGQPSPGSIYSSYPTQGLYTAKDVYRRNREVIIFSYAGVYAINIIDAYISSRLKYFDVGENIAIRITPGVTTTASLFGLNTAPSLKLSLKL